MPDWLFQVLTSEFSWGLLAGLVLSFIGAFAQTKMLRRAHISMQEEDIVNLASDLIKNIVQICDQLSEARRRSRAIHHELLNLLDVEIGIYGRTREQFIRLDPNVRSDVRKFFTNCALRKLEIVQNLAAFDDRMKMVQQFRLQGNDTEREQAEIAANVPLTEANKRVDELISLMRDGQSLVERMRPSAAPRLLSRSSR